MKHPRRRVAVFLDGRMRGFVRVAWNARERDLAPAACRLPGVMAALRRKGIAGTEGGRGGYAGVYKMFTRLPAELRLLVRAVEDGRRRGKVFMKKGSPFAGLGVPHRVKGRLKAG